jgi:23S rRNA (adenine2503-C2)-methyltransferase
VPSTAADPATPLQLGALRQRLRALGAAPVHEQHLLRGWVQLRGPGPRRRPEHFLPLALREAWPGIAEELAGLVRLHSEHPGDDGSARLLLALRDGQTIESVLLPREGLCVSTQVGCAVGCVFCMTGTGGLLRQVGSAEIAAQVVAARQHRPVKKVVFMGMGEPAHNLEAVLEAIQFLGREGGIGHKNLVLSTVGDPRLFERLRALGPGDVKPALALSLHTTKAALRAELLPRAPRYEPAALLAEAADYARATDYPLQVQWTLLDGVNDGDDELEAVAALLKGRYAMLNLIPYNQVEGLPWRRPNWDRAAEMARVLNRQGVLTRLRRSAGQDVDAGCGQLRARAENGEQRISLHRKPRPAGTGPSTPGAATNALPPASPAPAAGPDLALHPAPLAPAAHPEPGAAGARALP